MKNKCRCEYKPYKIVACSWFQWLIQGNFKSIKMLILKDGSSVTEPLTVITENVCKKWIAASMQSQRILQL